MKIPFLDLAALHESMRPELDAAVQRVLDAGMFVLGPEVEAFEEEFAAHVGARHCVAVGNGLDALHLSLRALDIGPGDEVLVPSHTFVATWLAVDMCGATPVPVEPAVGSYLMDPQAAEAAVGPRTAAVLPVHLYGEAVELAPFEELAERRGLALLQDAAQAHGARRGTQRVGESGTATWSFYPGKNLGAFGDAGAVTTDDAELADRLRRWRNYGSTRKYVHEVRGFNSRLDELQAALLRVKLRHLDHLVARRREVAAAYLSGLRDLGVELPDTDAVDEHAWHLFVVRADDRDQLAGDLAAAGVATQVHYPSAVHQQPAYAKLGHSDAALPLATEYARTVLSLPMDPTMSDAAVDHVVTSVRAARTRRPGAR